MTKPRKKRYNGPKVNKKNPAVPVQAVTAHTVEQTIAPLVLTPKFYVAVSGQLPALATLSSRKYIFEGMTQISDGYKQV